MIALAVSGLGATRPAFYAVCLLCLPPTPYAQKVITPFILLRNMQTAPPTNDYTTPQGGGKQRTMQKKIPALWRGGNYQLGSYDQLLDMGRNTFICGNRSHPI